MCPEESHSQLYFKAVVPHPTVPWHHWPGQTVACATEKIDAAMLQVGWKAVALGATSWVLAVFRTQASSLLLLLLVSALQDCGLFLPVAW